MAFAEAIRRSIAPDGGMYMPGDLPKLPRAFFNNMGEMSLREIAYVVAATFLGEDLDPSALKKIVDEAFAFDAPLVQIADDTYVLELYHADIDGEGLQRALYGRNVKAFFSSRQALQYTRGDYRKHRGCRSQCFL